MTRVPIAEPIQIEDEFDAWHFDRLREQFVKDVCEKLNNGQAERWLELLRNEDIRTYTHLANLKHSEWNDIKSIPVNARKDLKNFVNLEKQMAAGKKKKERTDVKAFEEMRENGFADDGLFDRMKKFFLPLTLIEQDLRISDTQWSELAAKYHAENFQLENDRTSVIRDLAVVEDHYYNLDELMTQAAATTTTRTTTFDRQISAYRKEREDLEPRRSDLRTRLEQIDDMIKNINMALTGRTHTTNDKKLLKPNRGFIMYGPPGTGKSDIMTNLSKRMGISMVVQELAAGDLNRSLVGQSERIINDICMRCHLLPHLMCCVCIDEIDSLAPKRTGEAREGDIAKLSVLLSVIDGIKDVPNLMIFCATNRMHMMDDAFLRRMQGKFFVGRPSSQARKAILSGIKSWHMKPALLENLTMATTNFSGAALK
ncbi:unnamed protein product [Didymodactylos carnosus]|uniref:AAA+ ATPase domain-containing protein n=1 Tax=Didymodactylos carnosus TaxID=1234261 RepID=A0A8S2PB65_9BILA|nr:unnamed protein product [Didymodactylos carnosus]CAF4043706.1 unnamed protein product [Didymodactylos carnosus]